MPQSVRLQRAPLQCVQGALLPLRAAWLLARQPGLWRFAVLPLLVNIVVYCLILAAALAWLWKWDPELSAQDGAGWVSWLTETIGTSLPVAKWLIAVPLLLLLSYVSFVAVGTVIASPLNDMLSERVERVLCQPQADVSLPLRLTVPAAMASVWDSFTWLVRQAVVSAAVLPLLLIPAVGMLPLLLTNAYYTGAEYLDVGMARNGLRRRHKTPVLAECRWQVVGLGAVMQLLFLIPFLGLLVLPLGVTAGTLLYCELDWAELLQRHGLAAPPGFTPPCAPRDDTSAQVS